MNENDLTKVKEIVEKLGYKLTIIHGATDILTFIEFNLFHKKYQTIMPKYENPSINIKIKNGKIKLYYEDNMHNSPLRCHWEIVTMSFMQSVEKITKKIKFITDNYLDLYKIYYDKKLSNHNIELKREKQLKELQEKYIEHVSEHDKKYSLKLHECIKLEIAIEEHDHVTIKIEKEKYRNKQFKLSINNQTMEEVNELVASIVNKLTGIKGITK